MSFSYHISFLKAFQILTRYSNRIFLAHFDCPERLNIFLQGGTQLLRLGLLSLRHIPSHPFPGFLTT